MKSRALFFNKTVFKKNITRFAPVWALYSAMLLMITLIMASDASYFVNDLADSLVPFAIINCVYAPICAMLLFGDLYNSRMCNALHAMPMRRETWFFTNVLSGLLFSIVPNGVMALFSLLLVDGIFAIPLLFWLGATMQYLFFFGTAVLAVFCAGNRFAMGLVYIIINGFSLIIYWLTYKMYGSILSSVVFREDSFYLFSPVVKMASDFEYLSVDYPNWYFQNGWGYMGICVVIGLVCFALALAAYRRRNLECAGDFIAIPWLSPIFLILYTLCGGACCHGFFSLFVGEESYSFLILGFIIGFFTGRMLLERTVRVFRKKTFLGFIIFMLAFCLSFLVVWFDLFGIVRWVPTVDQVKGVNIDTGVNYYTNYNIPLLTDPAMIEDIMQIHQHGIENRNTHKTDSRNSLRLYISYVMKNGAMRQRLYHIDYDTDAGRSMERYLSSPELVLGKVYTGEWIPEQIRIWDLEITDPDDVRSLLDAIIADCLAVNLSQDWRYTEGSDYTFWMEIVSDRPGGLSGYHSFKVSSYAENIVTWLETHAQYAAYWEKIKSEYAK